MKEIHVKNLSKDDVDTIEKIVNDISENNPYIILGNDYYVFSGSVAFMIISVAHFINACKDSKISKTINIMKKDFAVSTLKKLIDSDVKDINKLTKLFKKYAKEG